jgi:predicted DCC family thiol-disulfide oxidoreductase YuxK
MTGRTVLYFDGACGLCDRFVDWLLRHDREGRLRYAPLQGRTAATRLPAEDVDGLATVVLEREGRLSRRSTAAIEAVAILGGAWRGILALKAVPRPLRDAIYDWVARHRYGWFGRRDTCRLSSTAGRPPFLP